MAVATQVKPEAMEDIMVEHLVIGKVYRLSKSLNTKCCSYVLQPGAFVEIYRQTSPNRVLISHQIESLENGQITGGDGHKVRKSSLRMSVEELTDSS